jgi:hypothetical protein
VQELLRHKSVKTTMIYTHVLNRGGRASRARWTSYRLYGRADAAAQRRSHFHLDAYPRLTTRIKEELSRIFYAD